MADYIVSPVGSDGAAGSVDAPWQTITKGLATVRPGDTLHIRGGTYNESVTNAFTTEGGTSWDQRIRIQNYEGEAVWMAPDYGNYVIRQWNTCRYVEWEGINLDATKGILDGAVNLEIWTEGHPRYWRFKRLEVLGPCNHIDGQTTDQAPAFLIVNSEISGDGDDNTCNHEFQYLTIHGGGDSGHDYCYGFYINQCEALVEHCEIYDMTYQGVQIYSGHNSVPSRCIVRNNVIHSMTRGVGHRAITLSRGTGIQCYNNLIYDILMDDPSDLGAITTYDSHDALICNNTLADIHGPYACGMYNESNSPGTKVANNLVTYVEGERYGVNVGGADFAASNNVGSTSPGFVDYGARNYHLLEWSPAINAGLTIPVATDLDGHPRPQGTAFCCGAYEYVAGGTTPPPPVGAQGELEEGYEEIGEPGSKPPVG